MITIDVKVKLPWKTNPVDEKRSYKDGTTVEKVLEDIDIATKDEGNYLIVINGKIEYKSYILQDGDELQILPALIGG